MVSTEVLMTVSNRWSLAFLPRLRTAHLVLPWEGSTGETVANTWIRARWASEGMACRRGVKGEVGEQLSHVGYLGHVLRRVALR